jgi:hypothetical protein
LLEQFVGDMSKSGARLYSGNIGRLVQRDIEHAIKLDYQMTVLSTQTGTRIGVATALCRDFDAIRAATVNSGLDLWNGDGYCHCRRRVLEARVERFDVCSPVGAAGFVNRNRRPDQAVIYGSSPVQCEGIGQGSQAQQSEDEDFRRHDSEENEGMEQTSCCLSWKEWSNYGIAQIAWSRYKMLLMELTPSKPDV